MAKFIVTGCAGFIGSHLCEKLLTEGHEVFGIDNFDPFYNRRIKEKNLDFARSHPRFRFSETDLADRQAVEKTFERMEADAVVHLAGKAGVRPSISDPAGYIRANISATQNLLEIMRERGIRKLAFASSSSVYGNTGEIPFSERQDVSRPVSPYAFTKRSCELLNYTWHKLYGLDVINLRFFTVYGPRQRPDLAIHKFTRLLLNGEEIPMFGDGSSARDYTYYEDTINGICRTLDYLAAHKKVYELINLGNNHPIPLREMIEIIGEIAGMPVRIQTLPPQAGDVDITCANIDKARKLLGYQPAYAFEQGIQNFVNWYRTNRQNLA
ncbi:MAG: GDP-mannose 4,6-dehydratase [Mangrovibacterium sp.]